MLFEGSEKKLEVITHSRAKKLREYPDSFIKTLLKQSRTRSIKKFSNAYCDAYLLSESSLFVWDHRLILITCGTTTLASAFLYLSKYIKQDMRACFFQRKNEFFPVKQKSSFYEDVKKIRKKLKGHAYRFGNIDEHHFFLFHLDKEFSPSANDQTVEILMYGLPIELRSVFNPQFSSKEIQSKIQITNCFSGFTIQDYTFQPHGYSLNALRGKEYYTIHATPQEIGSYMSFETNMTENINDIIKKILILLKPLKFDLITFSPISSSNIVNVESDLYIRNHFCKKQILCGFDVEFSSFQILSNQPQIPFEWN